MRQRIAILAGLMIASFISLVPQQVSAADECPVYHVIGVRGSGEPYEGFFGMGFRVGAYAAKAAEKMPVNRTTYESLQYPAVSVLSWPPPANYNNSVDQGVAQLQGRLLQLTNGCPGVRVGLIGYSQGAQVVHNALDTLEPQALRDSVHSVLLLADPRNGGGGWPYAITVNPEGQQVAIRPGAGVWPNSGPIREDIQPETIDFCIVGDRFCDNADRGNVGDLIGNPYHGTYNTCCNGVDWPGRLGRKFADRLLRGPMLTGPGRLGGTFIQPDLVDGWTNDQLNAEMADLKRNGINQVVLQWSANSKNKREHDQRTAVYPTSLPGYVRDTNTDVVGRLLSAAQGAGVDVWLGLHVNDDWWRVYAYDPFWLDQEAAVARAVAHDLWNKYRSIRSFKGWYLAFEMDNVHFSGTTEQDRMISFYRTVINDLRSFSEGTPVAVAPFFNALSTGLPGWQNSATYGQAWERILRAVDIDIVALQDGIGAGHVKNAGLAEWFAAMHKAIKDSGSAATLIADTETFVVGASGLQPMAVSQIKFDMDVIRDYVSAYWSFSYSHYQSPRSKFGTGGYQAAYEYFLNNGQVSGSYPSTPGGFTASTVNEQRIDLDWAAASDPVGVTGYHVYRDNELVATTVGPKSDFVDEQLDPGTTYQYRVMAMNGSGLNSNPTATVTATTPPWPTYPVNFARCGASAGHPGCGYTVDIPADPVYPDLNGNSLTDGLHSAPVYNALWQGRNGTARPTRSPSTSGPSGTSRRSRPAGCRCARTTRSCRPGCGTASPRPARTAATRRWRPSRRLPCLT